MERIVGLFREQPIRCDRCENIRGLERNLEVCEVQIFQNVDVAEGALDERLGRRMLVLFEQRLFERARVNADADRNATILACTDDLGNFSLFPDVAGIDPKAIHTLFYCFERETVIEVDICNKRDPRPPSDFTQHFRRVHIRHSDPHYLAPRLFKMTDLVERLQDIAGVCIAHGLDYDGRSTADFHCTESNLPG